MNLVATLGIVKFKPAKILAKYYDINDYLYDPFEVIGKF